MEIGRLQYHFSKIDFRDPLRVHPSAASVLNTAVGRTLLRYLCMVFYPYAIPYIEKADRRDVI